MTQLTQPAFPIMPIQDNFKRLIVPVPGLNKLEHFALEIYLVYSKVHLNDTSKELMNEAIQDAITFLNLLEEKTKFLNNDKNNEVAIFNS
jgi:HD superfamily phosphohydrolase